MLMTSFSVSLLGPFCFRFRFHFRPPPRFPITNNNNTGTTDPFLQCKIIRLMRKLCKGDVETSEAVNDILAQVATNTDTTKTVGNAILYETVMCIMEIHAESGLRVLAINSLGKFLSNNDRNIRYVGLSTLLATVNNEDNSDAMQRHRSTIIDCLQEPDVTIRRRALQLIFALINATNIENLVKELLEFISIADDQFKGYIATEIFAVANKFPISARWHVDTVLSVLQQAGGHIPEHTIPQIVQLLACAENAALQPYIVQRCYQMVREKCHHVVSCQVGAWCVGEFGDLLCGASVITPPTAVVTSSQALDLLQDILNAPTSSSTTRGIALTAVMKLSSRFSDSIDRIRRMVAAYGNNLDSELQQRSAEYNSIFTSYDSIRGALLERMPVAPRKTPAPTAVAAVAAAPAAAAVAAPAAASGGLMDLLSGLDMGGGGGGAAAAPASAGGLGDLLGLDLSGGGGGSMGGLVGGGGGPPPAAMGGGLMDLLGGGGMPAAAAPPGSAMGGGLMDLLGGLGSGGPVAAAAPAAMGGGLMDLLGGGTPAAAAASPAGGIPSITAWEKGGLKVTFDFEKNPANPNVLKILLTATNSTPMPMDGFLFQIAVPTNLQLQLQNQSASSIPPNNSGTVTQNIAVQNLQKVAIRMRVKISYQGGMGNVDELGEVSNFPPNAV